ncbi:hypothetical protein PC129_g13840 [Phytophthora cactorum]|nr:hypothetical protein Pcac1_g12127 [Phytophthora cactorum]KAG2812542.1 hypothetical protein PC111_g14774 [Phytophthora cactorum]KAG2905111.1 hypothetical protein PC115_g14745 [Phytophthora cactorum]KAG2908825.1 hypothetical protein PC114_g10296 [Phytophthora cactorum]KAG2950511.1 hypothetical protein PC117_g4394 [Phytophthora cactorum]
MKIIVATFAVALLASQVSAHGYLSQPAAYFPNGIDTSYNGILTESCDAAFAGLKWNDSPEGNTAMFTKSFPNSQFKTLKAMMDTVASDCGKTSLTGSPVDVSSLSSMTWQNDQEQKGFIDSHHGPCEAWIDDTRVFHSDDCRADFTAYPAEIPIDFSSCSGDCTFTFYWLALHEPNWQVYKQCALITNGSGGGAQTETTKAPASPDTPTTTTEAPASIEAPASTEAPASLDASTSTDAAQTTDAPASDGEYTSAPTTTTPAAGTVAPADVTEAPSTDAPAATSTSNCKTRRRRRMTANLRSEN